MVMNKIRSAAVAGMFYPADPTELSGDIQNYLNAAESDGPPPKAIVVPHAGYIYSGPIAASAYHLLSARTETITRVVLLGPSHRVPLLGIAASSADQFVTPLGEIDIDHVAIDQLLAQGLVTTLDAAHAMEHSLEVQLPFLQTILKQFQLIPLVVGDASAEQVSTLLDQLWGGEETLIVVSSDLSHYHDYNTAKRLDKATSQAIEQLEPSLIDGERACGCRPLNGLLTVAKQKGMSAAVIDLRNSGDTAGSKDQVVGYGAYVFH